MHGTSKNQPLLCESSTTKNMLRRLVSPKGSGVLYKRCPFINLQKRQYISRIAVTLSRS